MSNTISEVQGVQRSYQYLFLKLYIDSVIAFDNIVLNLDRGLLAAQCVRISPSSKSFILLLCIPTQQLEKDGITHGL